MMKITGSGYGCNTFFACIDQFGVFLTGCRNGSHAQQAIFCVVNNIPALWYITGNQFRNTNTEVYISTIMYIHGNFLCHFI